MLAETECNSAYIGVGDQQKAGACGVQGEREGESRDGEVKAARGGNRASA